jgi:hypothetical protein
MSEAFCDCHEARYEVWSLIDPLKFPRNPELVKIDTLLLSSNNSMVAQFPIDVFNPLGKSNEVK